MIRVSYGAPCARGKLNPARIQQGSQREVRRLAGQRGLGVRHHVNDTVCQHVFGLGTIGFHVVRGRVSTQGG